ncbi:addiction module protein [Variovorax sp. PDC80]|uniref:addiction module protein n=2 Tax=Comamonadaceae TaxID=80864 RepID=UPI000B30DBB7|nr:addiction module protein [Variovorax sp. PDC80]
MIHFREIELGSSDLQQALSSLSMAERIELAEELWDSVARDAESQRLSAREQEEVARRRAEHRADPQAVVPWDQVKASLKL